MLTDDELLDKFVNLLPTAMKRREGYFVKNLFVLLEYKPLPNRAWDINVYNSSGIGVLTPARARQIMTGLQVRLEQLGIQRPNDGSLESSPA